MSEYHRPWIVPVRHLVALLEVFNDLRALWAAQFHEEVVAVIHRVDHEVLHFLIVDLIRCVHVFQFRTIPKAVAGHQLSKALPDDFIALQFR